jgi:hypothetical protein
MTEDERNHPSSRNLAPITLPSKNNYQMPIGTIPKVWVLQWYRNGRRRISIYKQQFMAGGGS